jgi:hypothetical protein
MALTIPTTNTNSISLEEYVDFVARNVDIEDEASILASAPMLKALANNRTFLARFVNDQILRWSEFQPENSYTAHTILLALQDKFVIRANVWDPPSLDASTREWQDRLFFYQVPHDHNFSFMTVGYKGSGYATTLWETDPATLSGVPGDPVDLHFVERTALPEGKIMYYRAGRDIHSQEHPTEFSLSINLMVNQRGSALKDQHFFDLENRRIASVTEGGGNGSRIFFCHLARFIGDATTKSCLEALATAHPANRVRATAVESLAVLEPESAEILWRRAARDPHAQVRHAARAALGRMAGDRPIALVE